MQSTESFSKSCGPGASPASYLLIVLTCVVVIRGVAADDNPPVALTDQASAEADALRTEQYEIANRLIERYPDDFESLRILGFVHSCHGNFDEMRRCWLKCVQLQPQRVDVLDQLAKQAAKVEQYDEALDYWQRAQDIDEDDPGLSQQIGDTLLKLGRAAEARQQLQQAVQANPQDTQSVYLLGEACYRMRDYDAARENYLKVTRLAPTHAQAYYGLMRTYAQLKQPDEANRCADQFRKLESAAAEADRQFRQQFNDLTQMQTNLAHTCIDAGRVYLRNKADWNDSEKLWKRALELSPQFSMPRSLLAALYIQQQKNTNALAQYLELAKLEPNVLDHQQRIGFLQASVGNLKGAEAAMERIIALAPNDSTGYRSLCKLYLNSKQQPARALQLAQRAVQLDPAADSYFVLGWARAVNGQRQGALEALQQATKLDPDNATYRQLFELVRKN
ncbi:MAG: tetratricopeptide repeat protein [Pirellulaceae bacterium]|nr:tetratricopeptide repeat protein [Planctomycetales bacterium]